MGLIYTEEIAQAKLPPDDCIVLQTREKQTIVNRQVKYLELTALYSEQLQRLRETHFGIIERPNTITDIYNCHGLTFASKRTGIDLNGELLKILKDDNYILIDYWLALCGDVILYIDEKGDISHSGIVVSVPKDITNNTLNQIQVLSKWGSTFEAVHPIYNCPYFLNIVKFYRCQS
jgi:hypothetical protein